MIYPKSPWQRCMEHFYRNVFGVVPAKQIHAPEDPRLDYRTPDLLRFFS
ncbi:transposase, Mutator family [Desulfuromonas soudanensis]|uniref:Transposase, Mutator family n=1 Tax=Desulfuromonas soudanensis TaxID=1603606 RepID=A0A0M4DI67_9BACT|nr:transposase, Mutator family [Desulfuromonas soudanensis]